VRSVSHSVQKRWEEAHELPRFRPAYPHEQVVRWVFRNLDRNATPKILDLGCGAGRHAIFLASEGFNVSACDLSAVGLRELQTIAARRGLTIQTEQTSAHDLSMYPDGAFDAVICIGMMSYLTLSEAESMLCEVLRILRPGGKFLCITRNDGDGRLIHASPVSHCTWHLDKLDSNAPSDMEVGMDMLFFSRDSIQQMFSAFTNVSVDRMTYVHEGFADDDWVVTALKD